MLWLEVVGFVAVTAVLVATGLAGLSVTERWQALKAERGLIEREAFAAGLEAGRSSDDVETMRLTLARMRDERDAARAELEKMRAERDAARTALDIDGEANERRLAAIAREGAAAAAKRDEARRRARGW